MARVIRKRYPVGKIARKRTQTKIRGSQKKKYRARIVNVPRLSAFPEAKLVRHKYVENITIPAGTINGLASAYLFRANSTYDPNYTGGGHQPLYRDEMAAMYGYYTVLSSVIRVTFAQTPVAQCNFGIVLTKDTALTNVPTELAEQYVLTKPLIQSQRYAPLTLAKYYIGTKFHRTDRKSMMAEDTYRVSATGNPGANSAAYFHILVAQLDGSTTTPAVQCQVELYYTVIWRERVDATAS